MRTLNFTLKIEDNDLIEHKVRSLLTSTFGDSLIDIKTLPNTDHLKNDNHFLKLCKDKRNAQKNINSYIDNNRIESTH